MKTSEINSPAQNFGEGDKNSNWICNPFLSVQFEEISFSSCFSISLENSSCHGFFLSFGSFSFPWSRTNSKTAISHNYGISENRKDGLSWWDRIEWPEKTAFPGHRSQLKNPVKRFPQNRSTLSAFKNNFQSQQPCFLFEHWERSELWWETAGKHHSATGMGSDFDSA